MSRFNQLDPSRFGLPADVTGRTTSPALVVHLDHVRENVRRVIGHLGGDVRRWRPHVKTVKIPAVLAELARAGVREFKCATTREAETLARVLAELGIADGDILVAYPLVGPSLTRIGEIAAAWPATRFSVLSEDPEAIENIPAPVGVHIDVNPGMNRTGIPSERAGVIGEAIRRAGPRFRGIHFYDGHLHGPDATARRAGAFAAYDALVELIESLARQGHAVPEAITSGTPTFLDSLAHEKLGALPGTRHRASPGTVVYHDLRTEQEVAELDLLPAVVVFSRVVSHPREGRITADAGSKTLAAEAGDPCALALGEPGLEALTPNEEHLPFRVVRGPRPERGSPLWLVPRHVCPTVNLADEAILVEAGRVRDIVPVSARGHELRILPPG